MPHFQKIQRYAVQYFAGQGRGRVLMTLDSGDRIELPVSSANELHALAAMLDMEQPWGYDPEQKILSSSDEIPGE